MCHRNVKHKERKRGKRDKESYERLLRSTFIFGSVTACFPVVRTIKHFSVTWVTQQRVHILSTMQLSPGHYFVQIFNKIFCYFPSAWLQIRNLLFTLVNKMKCDYTCTSIQESLTYNIPLVTWDNRIVQETFSNSSSSKGRYDYYYQNIWRKTKLRNRLIWPIRYSP